MEIKRIPGHCFLPRSLIILPDFHRLSESRKFQIHFFFRFSVCIQRQRRRSGEVTVFWRRSWLSWWKVLPSSVFMRQVWKVTHQVHTMALIGRFHSRGQHPYKFIGTNERVYIRKKKSLRLVWNTNMLAPVSLFWNTNMAAVTSCENSLLDISDLPRDSVWKRG